MASAKDTTSKKKWLYTTDIKVRAIKLSLHPAFQVKKVAEGLDIHPFMLSRWRKEYREGKLHGDGQRRVGVNKKKKTVCARDLSENTRLRKGNERLTNENDLLEKWQRYLAERRHSGFVQRYRQLVVKPLCR